jgi:putative ABC transport system permease protein
VVLLNDTVFTQPTVEALAARLGRTDQGLDLVPWYKLADFYNKTVQLFSRQLNVMRAIIGLIIVLSISNILVMAVMERTAEIGTLMAVGLRRRAILRLFLTEGLLLGLVGGIAGVSLGVLLALVISAIGIPMPPPPGMGHGVTGHIFVTPAIAVGGFLLALLTTLVASVYPAWKASRLVIVDALRRGR